MHNKIFSLIRYEELIPIFKELHNNLNKEAFLHSYRKFDQLVIKSKQIILNEDCLTGYEKGSIFFNNNDYSKELELEILRPITSRQMMCLKDSLNILYNDSQYYSNKELYEHDSLAELIDCIMDYGRCYKKTYVSYSEFLLFKELMDIFFDIFNNKKIKKWQQFFVPLLFYNFFIISLLIFS